MKKTISKVVTTLLFLVYLVIIALLIIKNSYIPQSYFILALFLLSNLPLVIIVIFRKDNAELKAELENKEAALHFTRKRWDSLLSLMPQMVYEYTSDLSGKILFINDFGIKLLGYNSLKDFKKMSYLDIFDPSERDKVIADKQQVIREKITAINEYICLRKDGAKFPVALYSAPILNENGVVSGVRSVVIDLSEIKRFKETVDQLHNLDKIKDDFLNIAAHELKTPLTSILVMSEILKVKAQKISDPEVMIQLDLIFTEAERLKRIVDQILTVTRFENKRNLAKNEDFNLVDTLREYSPTLESFVASKGGKLKVSLPDKPAIVNANNEKILEVIDNFVDNAMKYGKKGQVLKLNLSFESDKKLKLEVIDQGQGIEPDEIGRIFSKFSQLENAFSRTQEGIGLGLYICRLIIETYHGEIGVRSTIGKGSTFYFLLPLSRKK